MNSATISAPISNVDPAHLGLAHAQMQLVGLEVLYPGATNPLS